MRPQAYTAATALLAMMNAPLDKFPLDFKYAPAPAPYSRTKSFDYGKLQMKAKLKTKRRAANKAARVARKIERIHRKH